MQAAEVGDLHDPAAGRRLRDPRDGRILVQREVRSPPVIVREVLLKVAAQGALVPDDDVVEALAADGADRAFHEGVLPRRTRRREDFVDTHDVRGTPKVPAMGSEPPQTRADRRASASWVPLRHAVPGTATATSSICALPGESAPPALKIVVVADAFVHHGAWVSVLALAEAMWVLAAVYKRDARQIARAVEMLLNHQQLSLQEPEAVAAALQTFRKRSALGFSDCLLVELARKAGHLPLGTFDRDLSKVDGVAKL